MHEMRFPGFLWRRAKNIGSLLENGVSASSAILQSSMPHAVADCVGVQGTHSLQLHGQLETLSLKTDRGLHVDAQMCHRLLSFLAQKKRLRQVQVCSGYLRLQSIQGSPPVHPPPFVARLGAAWV